MSSAAKKQRSKILTIGSIPMATAVVAAFGMSTAYAQTNDTTNNGNADSLGRVALANTQPSWATPSAEKGAVPASQTISTRIFLAGQNQDQMTALAQAVADPSSPDYHKYLTPAQIQSQFGVTAAQVKTVTDWAAASGLKVTSIGDSWIDTQGAASTVQAAFGTTLANYTASDGQTHYAPSTAAMVPAKVASVIAGVSGLSDTPHVNAPASAPAAAPASAPAAKTKPSYTTYGSNGCSTYWGQNSVAGYPLPVCGYSPSQIRSAYGEANSGLTGKGATVAILDAYASPTMASDAAAYDKQFNEPQFKAGQYREASNPAAFSHQAECGPDKWAGEETMDVEAVHAMAPDANILYVAANSCEDNDLLASLNWIVNTHAADIVSASMDGTQHTTLGNEDPATRAAYDRIFMKGALEGIGFNYSTGDCGDDNPANAATGGNCQPNSARKQTEWPSSSAWVTAVGGTTLGIDSKGDNQFEEPYGSWLTPVTTAGQNYPNGQFEAGGGGGTSEDIPQPFYQRPVVPAAMADTLPTGARAKGPMRTTPDVAMDADSNTGLATFQTVNGGPDWEAGGGTSLSAPLFAATEALQMQAHGGVAPGFENPTIYANAGKFHQVTKNGGLAVIYPDYQGTPEMKTSRLDILGQDTSLQAAPGYNEATGVGSATLGFVQAPYDEDRVGRISGADRYQTGIQISQQQYPGNGSANAVVLATGTNFPDALAGVPLAKKVGGPLLLTPGNVADAQVINEIHRVLKPGGTVYVLGGTAAITPAVVNALHLPANQVQRIGGVNRYDTSVKIANALGNPSHVVLATGNGFADALAAGPYASTVFADNGAPAAILLTNDRTMTPAVAALAHSAKAVSAVGVQAVTAAANAHIPNVTGFAGSDRYDSAARVAATFHGEHTAGVATGLTFADALTGAAQLAQVGGPLVLTNVNSLPAFSANALHGINASLGGSGLIEIFGGPAAISVPTEYAIAAAAGAIVEG
ncbi:cell wall-binding repeat-containing protein [Catenulispora pinisilvae]|uniref:cell wall-binding repeat-containing protein n=1 Tax=Catenulispora pinisilvae TaxID=2705253 RepID=UPI00189154E8|nr:cell wall-binding repeat-containing protein [Catenulispora pinisilvae]